MSARITRDSRQRKWLAQQTPENVGVNFQLADPGSRLLAFATDMLIQTLVTLALLMIFGLGLGPVGLAIGIAISFALRTFYFAGLELAMQGATPGKRMFGIVVVSRDGGPLTAEMLLARNLVREVELFLPLSAMSVPEVFFGEEAPALAVLALVVWTTVLVLFPLINPVGARIGDLLGGTMVVVRPQTALRPDLVDRAESGFAFTPEQLDLYGIHELQVLESILRDRAHEFALLADVAGRITKKLGLPKATNHREFLEAFYAAQRARLEQRMVMGERRERKVR